MRKMARLSFPPALRHSAICNRPIGAATSESGSIPCKCPMATTEKIDATAMSLAYGPLKGSVSGSNGAKRFLVRSMTGVGTMAAYLVGGPGGFGGINGQLNNSVLLRERIASNAGLAGEQEMSSLAYNENIVVTVPGNTRFFLVLLQDAGERPGPRALPGGLRNTTQIAADGSSSASLGSGTSRTD